MTVDIRNAEAGDEAAWRRLWAEYLAFYDVTLDERVTASTWRRIMDPSERPRMRVAIINGQMAGFAIHHHHDSTWVADPDCYLEDLFLNETFRGQGAGRALMDDLIAICKENGWARLYWHTNENNATARKLYDRYVKSDGHVRYRIQLA